jgi:hypothetical protein
LESRKERANKGSNRSIKLSKTKSKRCNNISLIATKSMGELPSKGHFAHGKIQVEKKGDSLTQH